MVEVIIYLLLSTRMEESLPLIPDILWEPRESLSSLLSVYAAMLFEVWCLEMLVAFIKLGYSIREEDMTASRSVLFGDAERVPASFLYY